jgi:hypothetical protein
MAEQKKTTLQELRAAWKELQKDQPKFGAEMRALLREGREDLLTTLMGPLAGTTREPGAPGTPTPQQTTEALEGREVDRTQDRLEKKQPTSLEELRGYANERAKAAEQRMELGNNHHQERDGLSM